MLPAGSGTTTVQPAPGPALPGASSEVSIASARPRRLVSLGLGQATRRQPNVGQQYQVDPRHLHLRVLNRSARADAPSPAEPMLVSMRALQQSAENGVELAKRLTAAAHADPDSQGTSSLWAAGSWVAGTALSDFGEDDGGTDPDWEVMQPLLAANVLHGGGVSSYTPSAGRQPLAYGCGGSGLLACERGVPSRPAPPGAARSDTASSSRPAPPPPAPAARVPKRAAGGAPKAPRPPPEPNNTAASRRAIAALTAHICACGGTAELLAGWFAHSEVRKEGATAGTSDTYFFTPEGKRFRSRAEVARSFGLDPKPVPSFGAGERGASSDQVASRDRVASTEHVISSDSGVSSRGRPRAGVGAAVAAVTGAVEAPAAEARPASATSQQSNPYAKWSAPAKRRAHAENGGAGAALPPKQPKEPKEPVMARAGPFVFNAAIARQATPPPSEPPPPPPQQQPPPQRLQPRVLPSQLPIANATPLARPVLTDPSAFAGPFAGASIATAFYVDRPNGDPQGATAEGL